MLPACSLVVTSRSNLLVDMHGFPIAGVLLLWRMGSRGSRLQQFQLPFSRAQAQWFACTDLVVPWFVGSFWTRNQTGVFCIGRLTLYHQATRESPFFNVKLHLLIFCG